MDSETKKSVGNSLILFLASAFLLFLHSIYTIPNNIAQTTFDIIVALAILGLSISFLHSSYLFVEDIIKVFVLGGFEVICG
jgi:hypothetical protein